MVHEAATVAASFDPLVRWFVYGLIADDATGRMCCRLAEKVSEIDCLAHHPARDLRLGSPGDLLPG